MTETQMYEAALKKFGLDAQLNQLVEECSEVIKEVCKRQRGFANELQLIEELADLDIMLGQMKLLWSVEIETKKLQKLEKLRSYLNK